MLNFSSNNPGIGTENATQSPSSEPIIQEVYEAEPDDYNYVPPTVDIDENDIQNMVANSHEPTDKRVYYACAAFLVAALIGVAVGYGIASAKADSDDVRRKASLARTVQKTVETSAAGIKGLQAEFGKIAGANYGEASFDNFRTKIRGNVYPFMLDISSDVSAEAVLLIDPAKTNPLKGLRTYSAKTMLLRQLIETHLAETKADSEAIMELQSKGGDDQVLYAMQVIPDALYYLATTAPRSQYANGVISIFTYHDYIEDEEALSEAYTNLKNDGQWSTRMREYRDYRPTDNKEKKRIEAAELDLPNHILYNVVNRRGDKTHLFADEVVLVDRELFFGKSDNAKERYEWRTQNIKDLIDELASSTDDIEKALKAYIPEA